MKALSLRWATVCGLFSATNIACGLYQRITFDWLNMEEFQHTIWKLRPIAINQWMLWHHSKLISALTVAKNSYQTTTRFDPFWFYVSPSDFTNVGNYLAFCLPNSMSKNNPSISTQGLHSFKSHKAKFMYTLKFEAFENYAICSYQTGCLLV